jgi:hypothetical protein
MLQHQVRPGTYQAAPPPAVPVVVPRSLEKQESIAGVYGFMPLEDDDEPGTESGPGESGERRRELEQRAESPSGRKVTKSKAEDRRRIADFVDEAALASHKSRKKTEKGKSTKSHKSNKS